MRTLTVVARRLVPDIAAAALVVGVLVSLTTSDAQAAGNGTVTGVVTSSSGAVVPDAWVGIWTRAEEPDSFEADTDTDAAGAFTFTDVPAGEYVVHVYGKGDDLGTWHPSTSTQEAAGAVVVTAGGTTTADVQMIRASSISGTVFGADGKPARNVAFDLYQQYPPGCATCWDDYGDTNGTDSHGRYSYRVHPGVYRVRFISNPYQLLYYKNAKDFAHATDVVVGADGVTGIDVTLDPRSTVISPDDPPGVLPNTGF